MKDAKPCSSNLGSSKACSAGLYQGKFCRNSNESNDLGSPYFSNHIRSIDNFNMLCGAYLDFNKVSSELSKDVGESQLNL